MQKLDGTNFLSWKFQLRAILIAAGVSDIVRGSRVQPEDEESPAAVTGRKDAMAKGKAMVLISITIEMSQLESLITCVTAEEMWDALCRVHEQKSVSNKLFLTQKFHEYRMAGGNTIVQHVSKTKNMAQQLRDMGETVKYDGHGKSSREIGIEVKCFSDCVGQRSRSKTDNRQLNGKTRRRRDGSVGCYEKR